VAAKWRSIVRRPEKLLDMFTGYCATRGVVRVALQRAGMDPFNTALWDLPQWTAEVRHDLSPSSLSAKGGIDRRSRSCTC